MGRYKRHKRQPHERFLRSLKRMSKRARACSIGLDSVSGAIKAIVFFPKIDLSGEEMVKRLKDKFSVLKEAVEAQ